MGGTTPKFALPYPTGTDRVADGDNAIQALAEKIEQQLMVIAGRQGSRLIVWPSTRVDAWVDITLPNALPGDCLVVANAEFGGYVCTIQNRTPNSFSITAQRSDGTPTNSGIGLPVFWHARAALAGVDS